MKASLLLVCLMFANSVRSFPQNQPEKLKMPGPDVQNLMLGTWSTQIRYAPTPEMPKGGMGSGTEIWRPGPGGLSVIEEYHERNEKGDVEGLGVAWWDSKTQGQRFLWCDTDNPDGCYVSKEVSKWNGTSLEWKEEQEHAGKKRMHSEVFREITPTSFTQVLGEGEPGEATKTTVTIQARKVSEMNGIAVSAGGTHPGKDAKGQETTNNMDKNSEAAKLVALTNEWTDAINSRNRQKLDVLMASDFALYRWNGQLGAPRAQWLDNLFNHIKITTNTLTDAVPQVYGDFGVVTSVGDWIGTFDSEPFSQKCIVVDTWRKIDRQWKVVRRTSHCYTEDSVSGKLNWNF